MIQKMRDNLWSIIVVLIILISGSIGALYTFYPPLVEEQRTYWSSPAGLGRMRGLGISNHIGPIGPAYPQRYDDVGPFSFYKGEYLAQAKKDGKWFHIHPNGSPTYAERYDYVSFFCEGRTRAWKDGKKFYLYFDGTRVER